MVGRIRRRDGGFSGWRAGVRRWGERRFTAVAVGGTLLAGALGIAPAASAQLKTWVGADGANWRSSGSWSPSGKPGPSNIAEFGQTGAYVVNYTRIVEGFGGQLVTAGLEEQIGGLRFNFGSPTVVLGPTRSIGTPLNPASAVGRLTVSGDMTVGNGASVNVVPPTGVSSGGDIVVSNGSLVVGQGLSVGSLRLDNVELSSFATSVGTGSGSSSSLSTLTLDASAELRTGSISLGNFISGPSGLLRVEGGADVVAQTVINVQTTGGIEVSDFSSKVVADEIVLRGSLLHLGGEVDVNTLRLFSPYALFAADATLRVEALDGPASNFTWTGGRLVWDNDLTLGNANPYFAPDLVLTPSRTLQVEEALTVADGSLTLNDQFLVIQDDLRLGDAAADGQAVGLTVTGPNALITIDDNGSSNAGDNAVRIGDADAANVTIGNGGLVGDEALLIEVSTVPGGQTDVQIDGAGSRLGDRSTPAPVFIGGSQGGVGGAASVTLRNGGELGASDLTVYAGGTVDAADGIVEYATLNVGGTVDFGADALIDGGPIAMIGGTLRADTVDYGTAAFAGFGNVEAAFATQGDVTATGPLQIGDATRADGVEIGGTLTVGPNEVVLRKAGFFTLGNDNLQTVANSTVVADNGFLLPSGAVFRGRGALVGRFASVTGAVVEMQGDLSLGDAESPAGVFLDGEVNVGANTLRLLDANDAVLGSLTTLGDGDDDTGELIADNGLTIGFGRNLVGQGTVETPDDPFRPLINNGSILGDSSENPIVLEGFVKGVGTLDHVVITGTDAPGFSPATVYRGSVGYAGKLQIELGGTGAGQFDRVIHSGTADLGGELSVALIDGYVPTLGDAFAVLTAPTLRDTFDVVSAPTLGAGLTFDVVYTVNEVFLNVVAAAGLAGDYNGSGSVEQGDLDLVLTNWGGPRGFEDGVTAFLTGNVDQEELDLVLTNWGSSAAPGFAQRPDLVPEPAAVALLGLLGLLALGRTRRVFP